MIANLLLASLTAYSMVTHDGRRVVSRDGGATFELVATNALPTSLPPVRPWKFYILKATHTDIGLHNSQYIQRHGAVKRIEDAARLIDADRRGDDDPAAYRYVMEGAWFWSNYPMDRGEAAAWNIISNYVRRGRMDIGVTCAGNHTHLMSGTELERSTLTKKLLETKWGVKTKTFIMADNPGMSWSIVKPYAQAGIKYGLFLPNQWNPIPSTIWKRNDSYDAATWNPDARGGGARVEVSYDSPLPMLFRWQAADSAESLLIWCSTQYDHGWWRLGLDCYARRAGTVETTEKKMPAFLEILERKYPYDLWLASCYGDDEPPNTAFADFAAEWNAKWAIPEFRTVGRLDEPFEEIERRFGDRIPVLRGEMTSGWLQHAVSTPELLADKLNADRMLETAERLGEYAGTIDRLAVDQAWWYLILNDEHSYGTSGYQGRRVFETWLQHRDWIERAAAIASNELQKATMKLGIARTGTSVLPKNAPAPGERTSPSVPSAPPGERTSSSVPSVPPGERTSPSVPSAPPGERTSSSVPGGKNEIPPGTVAENRWYRVAVNERGEITSIYDKEIGRELLNGVANKFLYTRDNHKTWVDESLLGAKITRRVSLPRNVKRIDIVDTFEHARDLFNSNRYYRYGYLAFPFAVADGAFKAQLAGGEVIRPYEDCHPMTADAYTAVRDWCAVENDEFGVALMMRDSTLTEFGEIHPDKTCYTGKPPEGKTAVYPYLFTDWLQMHQPDGDSMNFTFRFAITSYAGRTDVPVRSGRKDELRLLCEDWLDPYAAWMREHRVPRVRRDAVAPAPREWTGLVERPRAIHGELDGQLYIEWGADGTAGTDEDVRAPDTPVRSELDHYDLYRDGGLIAQVTNEIHDTIPYRVARYVDMGLPTHSVHRYRVEAVMKNRETNLVGECTGRCRYMSEEERNGVLCEGEKGRLYTRYDGGTVTSWKPGVLKGGEMFFMPKVQPWGREVHGGLPICWPWFGKADDPLPKHGLVRYLKWRYHSRWGKDEVTLVCASDETTRRLWPHDFELKLKIRVDGPDVLNLWLTETNTGKEPFESEAGLHPYFRVTDAEKVALDGEALPKPWTSMSLQIGTDGDVRAPGRTDVPVRSLTDLVSGRRITVSGDDVAKFVVWNPGVERTSLCEGLASDDWRRFYCLEPVSAKRPLAPGESRTRRFTITSGTDGDVRAPKENAGTP